MNGKTIRVYLVDGSPAGVQTAEIINWTGKVIVAPRAQLDVLATRAEARRTGVYLLVGPDPEVPTRDLVYVGEGDNVLARLLKHNRDEKRDFWSRTAVIISKDENLTKSHVRHLESRLIELTKSAGRARLNNDTEPPPAPLPEPAVADMEFFLGQLQMVLPVLGFTFTQPLPSTLPGGTGGPGTSPLFVMSPVGTAATAQEVNGEFIVLRGSTARKHGVDSWTTYKGLRDQLVAEGKLADGRADDLLVFTEDVPFSSPSAAAAVVYGGSQRGTTAWKVKDTNQTYLQWQEQKLASVSRTPDGEGEEEI
jgi:hypothetical protein